MDEAPLAQRLRSELEAAARQLPEVAGPPPAGLVNKVTRARKRRRGQRVTALLAATVVVAVGLGTVVNRRDRDRRVIAAGEPRITTSDVTQGLDASPGLGLRSLRQPSVTATADGFLVWGGLSGPDPGRSDVPADLEGSADPRFADSGVGAYFSLQSGAWRTVAPSPLVPRARHAAVATDTEVVIAGGAASLNGRQLLSDVAAYNPRSDSWRALPPLPEPRMDASAVFVNGRIVIAGGRTADGARTSTVLIGSGSAAWTTRTLSFPVDGVFAHGDVTVAYGFTGDADQLVLRLAAVEPAVGEIRELVPLSLGTSEPVTYAFASSGDGFYAALGRFGSADVSVWALSAEPEAWSLELALDDAALRLPGDTLAGRADGAIARGSQLWLAGPQGVTVVNLADRRSTVYPILDGKHCEDAVTYDSSVHGALFWVDRSCPVGPVVLFTQFGT